jgi:hypothetical protein
MTSLSLPFSHLARVSRLMEIVTDIGIVLIILLVTACFLIPDWTRNLLLAKLGQAGAVLPVTPAPPRRRRRGRSAGCCRGLRPLRRAGAVP